MKTGELCMRDVIVSDGETGIVELAGLMREYHVGDIVITKDRNGVKVPVGIITDRDIVLEIVAKEVSYSTCIASDIMSDDLVTANEDDELWRTLELMRAKGVRRIPVVSSDSGLAGIVSADDIVDFLAEEMKQLVSLYRYQSQREKRRYP